MATLTTGDVRFLTVNMELVLIERKSTEGDLYTSSAKRLQDQCLRLIEEADVPILLIDGPMYLGRGGVFRTGRYNTGWQFSSITHMLLTLQMRGLLIIYVPKQSYSPQEIINLYKYFQKTEHDSLLQSKLKPFPTTTKGLTPKEEKLRVLMSLPSVGPELANRLLDVYGSVRAVADSQEEGLASIPGLGHKTATKIKEALR
jgi:ERCC4-type nuclease